MLHNVHHPVPQIQARYVLSWLLRPCLMASIFSHVTQMTFKGTLSNPLQALILFCLGYYAFTHSILLLVLCAPVGSEM